MFTAIAGLLAAAAPLLALFFSSDKQPIVEKGIEIVSTVLGCPPEKTSIEKELQNNPEALVKLREYELQKYSVLSNERVALENAYVQNVTNAREMAVRSPAIIEIQREVMRKNIYLLAATIICTVLMIAFRTEIFKQYPEVVNVIYVIITALVMNVRDTNGFFFGSSADSRSKTEMIFNSRPFKSDGGGR